MRTDFTLRNLEDRLQENCGDMLDAAKSVGVSLMFITQWCKDDALVNQRLQEAQRVGAQKLYSAAVERAVNGVDKAIYYKGEVVGHEKVYSDGLLQSLLKAKLPEFAKDGEGGGGVNVNVNIANIMPRANSYEEWLNMKKITVEDTPEAIEQDKTITIEAQPVSPFKGLDF